ncbi:BZIP transcription factor [Colletotrichum tofieldiae]|nr:BZIP transcription factor [Colletotrichum tofieldiae]GKT95357.1 BZIP transcription factor [Colletotrichum tofieldiae]
MSVYAAVSSGAPPSHRSSPNSDGRDSEVATPHADKILRRQRNTIAARKYRQKKVDRIDELESLLKEMTRERDDLRIRLARQEAETEALKSIMRTETKQ